MDGQSLFIVLFIAVAIVAAVCHFVRAASILDNWATRNGFRIVSRERCAFWHGPFFLRTSRSQEVYRVTIEDRAGQTRSGYVRCGGYFFGMFSDEANVVWDRELEHHRPGFPVVFPDRKDE